MQQQGEWRGQQRKLQLRRSTERIPAYCPQWLDCVQVLRAQARSDGLSELRRYVEIALPLAVCLLGWVGFFVAWQQDHPPQSDPIPLAPLLILATFVIGGGSFAVAYFLRGALAGKS